MFDQVWEHHQFLIHQCFSLPGAFLFYFLTKWGYLSLTYRYVFVSVGGCVLAVVTMGIYSMLLFLPAFAFILLVCSVDPSCIHAWAFAIQMLWQTFWHLIIQYREYYLHENVCIRLFLAVSSLMLLTQRITSVSMDLMENRVILTLNASCKRKTLVMLLPLISYVLNFTTLLGGPLFSYSQFVSRIADIRLNPSPNPLCVVLLKMVHVLLLVGLRYCLIYFLRYCIYDSYKSITFYGFLWVWGLAMILRIRYYSHWKISECLNNAAGFGFWENLSGDCPDRNKLSDGDIWSTESSSRMSEFARQWNATTASWLRRLVYMRCKYFPLFMTFSFSLWWHGLHLGHFVGILTWAATVKADYHIYRYLHPRLSSMCRKIYHFLSWINTQMIVSCIVMAVELRDMSGLRLLCTTYIGLFPLLNVIMLFLLSRLDTVHL
ncbi:ghrelin O-acyltransferase [Antennarius striatus]|uniref:ghrelin O-acyltransferase n=1 Tax=Antennarius striatus TaxID=241820 RepID=UPI0035B25709